MKKLLIGAVFALLSGSVLAGEFVAECGIANGLVPTAGSDVLCLVEQDTRPDGNVYHVRFQELAYHFFVALDGSCSVMPGGGCELVTFDAAGEVIAYLPLRDEYVRFHTVPAPKIRPW